MQPTSPQLAAKAIAFWPTLAIVAAGDFITKRIAESALTLDDAWQALALGLVAGGALGNLSDRIRSANGVVDFIDIGTTGWRFYTFNVADAGVTAGAVLLALLMFRRPSADPPGSRYVS